MMIHLVVFHGLLTLAQRACQNIIIQTSRRYNCMSPKFHVGQRATGEQPSGYLGKRRRLGKDKATEGPGLTVLGRPGSSATRPRACRSYKGGFSSAGSPGGLDQGQRNNTMKCMAYYVPSTGSLSICIEKEYVIFYSP